jgi:hypothetical protein
MYNEHYCKALYDILDELDTWIEISPDTETLQLFRTNLVLRIDAAHYSSEVPFSTEAPLPEFNSPQLLLELDLLELDHHK